jgi:hypothetical protein
MTPDGSLPASRSGAFYRVITEAVRDFAEHGYDSQARLDRLIEAIRAAAIQSLVPESVVEAELRGVLARVYEREINRGAILKQHKDVPAFTIERVKPKLRAEMDRRVRANAGMIKLNRAEAVDAVIHRFQGWATSIPAGGSDVVEKVAEKQNIRKSMSQLNFRDRRCGIDQSHKLVASLSKIIADDGGALAMRWSSMWRTRGYDYREPHKERDGLVYAIRGNWALQQGLMKAGPPGYTDQITAPAEEISCQCSGVYLYHLRALPLFMLTQKGIDWLAEAKAMAA